VEASEHEIACARVEQKLLVVGRPEHAIETETLCTDEDLVVAITLRDTLALATLRELSTHQRSNSDCNSYGAGILKKQMFLVIQNRNL
jgi:hypothetical protein